jgi:hypothetical protein
MHRLAHTAWSSRRGHEKTTKNNFRSNRTVTKLGEGGGKTMGNGQSDRTMLIGSMYTFRSQSLYVCVCVCACVCLPCSVGMLPCSAAGSSGWPKPGSVDLAGSAGSPGRQPAGLRTELSVPLQQANQTNKCKQACVFLSMFCMLRAYVCVKLASKVQYMDDPRTHHNTRVKKKSNNCPESPVIAGIQSNTRKM